MSHGSLESPLETHNTLFTLNIGTDIPEQKNRSVVIRPEVIKLFSCSTQLSMKFSLLINMKMPTIVGIFIFISREIFMLSSFGCAVRLETRRSRVQPPPRSATFFRGDWSWNIFYGHSLPSADSRRAVVSFWRKNVHNTGLPLGGLSLPIKCVVR